MLPSGRNRRRRVEIFGVEAWERRLAWRSLTTDRSQCQWRPQPLEAATRVLANRQQTSREDLDLGPDVIVSKCVKKDTGAFGRARLPWKMTSGSPTSSPLLYLLDDDPVFAEIVTHFLAHQGYRITAFDEAPLFLAAVAEQSPQLALIDLELGDPNKTGLDVIERLRQTSSARLSILVLTNHDCDEYYLQANRCQVDGFLEKRRDLKVLASFIDSILKRNTQEYFPPADQPAREYWSLDSFHWVLKWHNGDVREVKLTEKEFLILEWLNRKHGAVVAREKLITFCNALSATPIHSKRSIDNIIRRLREKIRRLNPQRDQEAIESIYGGGYRLLLQIKIR